MRRARPDLLHRILAVNARAVTDYLNAQIEAGAQVVMLFDTWGGSLNTADYEELSLAYMRQVLAALRPVPSIVFTKDGGAWLESIAASGCSAVGLDWTIDPGEARRRIGAKVALQGNLDPAVLTTTDANVRDQARRVLDAFGTAPGHVFNLGHGITPQARPDAVAALVDEVRAYSSKLRAGRG
jgi:uroporphyrinogen decarboxylase